jgi:hypothetical protein
VDFTQVFEKLRGLDPLETMQVEINDEAIYQCIQGFLSKFFECENPMIEGTEPASASMQSKQFSI